MRILHIIDSLIEAGAEALVKDMVPRMQGRGIDVSVAVLKELDNPFERELREKGVPFLPTAPGGIYSPAHVVRLANHLHEFDLVQLYLFPAQLFAPLAAVLAGTNLPLVLSEQTTSNRRRTKWLHQLDVWMYSHYAAIACASEGIAASLRDWIPGVSEKITVIHNGIDVRHFQQAAAVSRVSLGINETSCVLLYVASFQSRKDHGTLLRALKEIPDADLILVGDGELRNQLECQARSLGVAGRVHFLGRRNDVAELLNMADIYVHVPTFEGFGIAVAEAMASGKPIVASDVPGLAQVVENAGILIQPGDPSLLARVVRNLIASPERRSKLSRAAVQRANQFGIDKTVDAYLELYESILANPTPRSPKLQGVDRFGASEQQKVELRIS